MMKNDFGIVVQEWQDDVVKGIDYEGKPFEASAMQDDRLDTYFNLYGERWYAKDFLSATSELPILKLLDLSTAHIRQETDVYLREQLLMESFADLIVYEKGAGYFVWVPKLIPEFEVPTSVPDELKDLLRMAAEKDCSWLVLEADGPILDILPRWYW